MIKLSIITERLGIVNSLGEKTAVIGYLVFLLLIISFIFQIGFAIMILMPISILFLAVMIALIIGYFLAKKQVQLKLEDIQEVTINATSQKSKQSEYMDSGHFLTVINKDGNTIRYEIYKKTLVKRILPNRLEAWRFSYEYSRNKPQCIFKSFLFMFPTMFT